MQSTKSLSVGSKGFLPIIAIIVVLAVLGGGVFAWQKGLLKIPQKQIVSQKPVACTQEAKICPDGSAVGRTGPNCEFAQCPSVNANETAKTVWDQSVVWNLIDKTNAAEILSALHACDPSVDLKCVIDVMAKYGASQESINFYQQTGGWWFVSNFKDYGKVDLLAIFNPWRANSNTDYTLVNGTPNVVVVEDIASKEKYGEEKQFPNYSIYPTYNSFVKKDGNAFVFEFPMVNGCKLCKTGYGAVISFDFDTNGNYQGSRLTGFCTDSSVNDQRYPKCLGS